MTTGGVEIIPKGDKFSLEELTVHPVRIIDSVRVNGRVCSHDLTQIGASRTTLAYMTNKGLLRRIARGIYVSAEKISENETLQAASLAVPNGVICLLSALQFHELTTQMPLQTWIAVERGKTVPQSRELNFKVIKVNPAYFNLGINEYQLQDTPVRVYSPAKTVVDCFKYRNKTGIDIAREALKDAIFQRKTTTDEIYHLAKKCRMLNVMRPYMEMI
jgi:predicted transcriptional regulator of viral defense system